MRLYHRHHDVQEQLDVLNEADVMAWCDGLGVERYLRCTNGYRGNIRPDTPSGGRDSPMLQALAHQEQMMHDLETEHASQPGANPTTCMCVCSVAIPAPMKLSLSAGRRKRWRAQLGLTEHSRHASSANNEKKRIIIVQGRSGLKGPLGTKGPGTKKTPLKI